MNLNPANRLAQALLLLALVFTPSTRAEARISDQTRFLAGLRERSLFRLARHYCQSRLANPELSESELAALTIELSHTLSREAMGASPATRDALWQEAAEAIERFVREHPDAANVLQVRFQGALGRLSRGELLRQEAEVLSNAQAVREEARESLREAIEELEDLIEQVEVALRAFSRPGGPDDAGLSSDQLGALGRTLRYHLARGYQNLARCHPDSRDDQLAAFDRAAALLDPLVRLDLSHPLAARSRLEEAVCHRVLGDPATASARLDRLEEDAAGSTIASDVVASVRAERIRLALSQGQLERAVQLVRQLEANPLAPSGDLDHARMEVALASAIASEKAGDEAAAASWREAVDGVLRRIRQRHGPYWVRRAQMLLASHTDAESTDDVGLVVQGAENAYHAGQIDDALERYDRAAALAGQHNDTDQSIALARTAAAIAYRHQAPEKALVRYRQLAMQHAGRPDSPRMHQMAVHLAGRAAGADTSEASRALYTELLAEHLKTWSEAPTADAVRWRLGQLRQVEKDWQNALAALTRVSPTFEKNEQVIAAVDVCYREWLDQRDAAGDPTEQIAADAAKWFATYVQRANEQSAQPWGPAARRAVLAAARLWLHRTRDGLGRAEQLLVTAIGGASDAPGSWQSTARAMLLCALAGQGRHAEASALLTNIQTAAPGELVAVLESLARVAGAAPDDARAELAAIRLDVVRTLAPSRDGLTSIERKRLDTLNANALVDAGRAEEALAIQTRLAGQYPRDRALQTNLARILATFPARREEALAGWQVIASRTDEATADWFEAKYEIARLHHVTGHSDKALRLIRLVEILHPEMGGTRQRERFLGLRREME